MYVLPVFLCARQIAYSRTAQTPVDDSEKELVMKNLVLSFCKFSHEGGANLAPADTQYFSMVRLPAADQALMRGAKLSEADENEDMEMTSKSDRDDGGETIRP